MSTFGIILLIIGILFALFFGYMVLVAFMVNEGFKAKDDPEMIKRWKKQCTELQNHGNAQELVKEAASEDEAQQVAESEERKKKREEIKKRTIDITKSNLHEYSSLDVVAFSFAVPGAQGEGGGIYIISEDGNVYHTNLMWDEITLDDAFLICPPLRDCRFGLFGADPIPDGWGYYYMGAGNHLFVRNDFVKCVDETGLENVDLYQQWKYIVMQAIEKNNTD